MDVDERKGLLKLLDGLGADAPAVREKATTQLAKSLPRSRELLRKAYVGSKDPEVKMRLEKLLTAGEISSEE